MLFKNPSELPSETSEQIIGLLFFRLFRDSRRMHKFVIVDCYESRRRTYGDHYCRLACDSWPWFTYFLKKTLWTIIEMPPLCNYNNNDDDFATEYAIQGIHTQLFLASFSFYIDVSCCLGLWRIEKDFPTKGQWATWTKSSVADPGNH